MQQENRLLVNSSAPSLVPPPLGTEDSAAASASPQNRGFFEQYWPFFLAGILIIAAVFRFTGVDWDQDQHLHPDERFLTMVSAAIRLPNSIGQYFDTAESPMNPYNNNFGSFVYGTAPIFIVRAIAQALGQADYGEIYMVGRVVSALFDLITCAMVFAIGRRLFDVRVGLFATLLYALAVLPIQQSHFFTVDAFGNVPIALAFWFTLDIMEGKRGWWAYALAGAFLGLAVASRINFLMFTAVIVMAGLVRLAGTLGSVKRVGLAGNETAPRTYAMDAGAVVGDSARGDTAETHAPSNVRTINIGPIIIEIETKLRAAQGENIAADATSFWNGALYIFAGLVICAVSALLVFRIGQPYAFVGFFGINPKWLDDIRYISDLISGKLDAPPSHQWTDRAAYLFPLYNIFNYGLGIPFALAAAAGYLVGVYEILRHRKWNHLLIVLWIGGFFLYQAQQFVLVLRYYLPLYPFFAIYAAFFVFWVWDRIETLVVPWKTVARVAFAVCVAVLVGYTLFWAAAFTSIYTRPVSRIAASIWMVRNIPAGSVIANEHWDDGLPLRVEGLDPFGGMFRGLSSSDDGSIQNYNEDEEIKREKLQRWLDEADYLVLSSNRLYGSIPRLPLRYPLTTKYYEWLFSGQLGFDLVQEFTSYPQLFGIVINDDSADEAFTVYDHPKVLIFKKSASYSSEHVAELLNSVDLSEVERLKPIDYTASKNGFKMSEELQAANYAGGTWSEIFNPNDLVNAMPVLAWLVTLWLFGVLAFPYTFVAFRKFADRGYAFAKAVGILAFAWLTWTLASYRVLPFERPAMWLSLGALCVGALIVVWRKRADMTAYLRGRWKLLLGIEVLFLAFFALDLAIRYANPDLWHPWFGGEKPMDFAYLNAVIKSTYFPAYNPWFEGGFINYYYFGQLISAALVKFTGIVPEVAYNLLLPMFFGLTATGAFGVAYNLVARAVIDERRAANDEQRLTIDGGLQRADEVLTVVNPSAMQGHDFAWLRPVVAGIAAAFLVLIIGNLGQVGVLFKGLTDLGQQSGSSESLSAFLAGVAAWIGGKEIPVPIGNWYWTATRIIPDTINEIPFFTFVYADLHAHLMSLPFTLVGLALAAHTVLIRAGLKWYDLGIAAMVLGALRAINTWDYPTYLALIGCAMVIGYFIDNRGFNDAAVNDRAIWSKKDEPELVSEGGLNWGELIQRYLLFIVLAFAQVLITVIPINAAGFKITFDMAIYVLVLLFALTLGFVKFGLRMDPRGIGWDLGWRMVALIALSVVFYWPYIANYGTAYTSVELWKDARTLLADYFVVHGIFLFLVVTYLIILVANKSARTMTAAANPNARAWLDGWMLYLVPALVVLELGLLFFGLHVFAVMLPPVVVAAWILITGDTAPVHRFLALIIVAALLLTLMVEVVTLKGDIGRMNTVFKFYLQAWVFFAVASAAGLAIVFHYLWFRDPGVDDATGEKVSGDSGAMQTVKAAWWGAAAILIFAGMLYPAFAGWAKMNDRFVSGMPPGLNGLDYMTRATYQEKDSTINLVQDYDAIQWLRENIIGSPVIVEANTGLYRWGNRVSINTGLPVIAGWDWHTKQQYSLLPGEIIDHRIGDIRTIYETGDTDEALRLLRKYGVSLVYVGPLERAVYSGAGLEKFGDMADQGTLELIYDQNGVQIYALSDKVAQVVR
ncbi:MAG: glycosyltransferase family 39 protein [Anaerolineae bacterium]|nr:glycosyltransferase family 39 protein [Anaerolineae bacterium]